MAGLHNEHTGPSDGAVFVASCAAKDDIAGPVQSSLLPLNHLQLGWATAATDRVISWLS